MKRRAPTLAPQMHQSSQFSKLLHGSTKEQRHRMDFTCGGGRNKLGSYPAGIPYPTSPGTVFKPLKLNKCALPKQTSRFYVTFVSGATLWDRGVYHYTHKHPNERTTVPCPRFTAHMTTSPDSQEYTQIFRNKSSYLPVKENYRQRTSFANTTSIWSMSENIRGRQRQQTQMIFPGHTEQNVPKQPVPSIVSSGEDSDETVVNGHAPITQVQTPPVKVVHTPNEKKEEHDSSKRVWTSPEIESYSKSDAIEKHCNQASSFCTKNKKSDSHHSRLSIERDSSICGGSDDESDLCGRVSCFSSMYRSCSTPLSQLRSSSLSLLVGDSSASEEAFGKYPSKITEHKSSPLAASGYCNSVLSPVLNSCSYHGNSDLLQASSYSVRKCSEASGLASSFVEIWHDRLLHHWPVLPPISPQRAFSESCSVGEDGESVQMSIISNGTQDAFDELEMIVPCTGSSLSLQNPDSVSDKDFPTSDICKRTASINLGSCDSGEGSLADVRLSLLDHRSWGKENPLYGANGNEQDNSFSGNTAGITNDVTTFHTQGLLHPPAPALLNVTKTSDTYSNKEVDDQQNIHTILTGLDEMKHGRQEEFCDQIEAHADNGYNMHSPELSFLPDSHSTCSLKELFTDENTAQNGKTVFTNNGLKFLNARVPKLDKDARKKEDGCHLKSERTEETPRASPLNRRRPVKLDHSIRQEMERQRIDEERRAQAIYMYSKLRSTQSTAIRGTQSMSISKFEDFDFLAKYCIFSQEKLAEYKRAFEAVDNDEDGYLNCLQVLMGLKEIVPSNVLSDAEELYVYRILEIVDYYVTDGLTDLRLFAVMASLAQKIAALDSFMRSLIDHMDFKALELKMYKAKQLFLCNIDSESKSITVDQLLVELKAGGVSREHEETVQRELSNIKKLDILDFLTYLPLFVLIHNSVISNPLDDSRKI
ncbi:hypothetical protein FKM82_012456 [Ascaphus truei]